MSSDRTIPIDTPFTGISLGVLFFFVALGISIVVEWAFLGGDVLWDGVVTGAVLGTVFAILIYALTRTSAR